MSRTNIKEQWLDVWIYFSLALLIVTNLKGISAQIRVEDVNDNQPEVEITSLSSRIPEDAPPGTVVALMGVTDLDSEALPISGSSLIEEVR
ncbi:hypothetical protein VZT92_023389 [Zoarces viviparus]|uniref:Uncharacterized protein n=1 Tax=Zoarces viviparus TaxID=48416 RepID=A0AAW1E732_ZOAVI